MMCKSTREVTCSSKSLGHLIAPVALVWLLSGCLTTVDFNSARISASDQKSDRVSAIISRPAGPGIFPAIVLLHSCGGLMPHVTEDWPRFFVESGFIVLSIDTFGSRGYGACPNGMDKDFASFIKDAYGALDWLAMQSFVDKDRVAVMGFSHGAIAINSVMVPWRVRSGESLNFKAAIALYGHCNTVGLYPKGSVPLLEIVGEKDSRFAESCLAASRRVPEIKTEILQGAYHAFDNAKMSGRSDPYGHRMQYSKEATDKARILVRDFLTKTFAH